MDDPGAAADTPDGVARAVDIGLVEAQLLHLADDIFGHLFFLVGIASDAHRAAIEPGQLKALPLRKGIACFHVSASLCFC